MAKTIAEITAELQQKPLQRSITLERGIAVDEETRTVNLAFASDKPVEHWFGNLELSMKKGAMRTDRLTSGAPLLMDHDSRDQIGVVENFKIAGGIARADVRFSRSDRGEEIFQDVKDGIRQSVSVGFMVHEMKLVSDKKDAMPTYRSDDWEPYEISIVSIPADISVGVGRSRQTRAEAAADAGMCPDCGLPIDECTCDAEVEASADSEVSTARSRAISNNQEKSMSDKNDNTPEAPVVETRSAAAIEAQRVREIVAFAEVFGEGDLARTMTINPAITLEDVRTAIQAKQKPAAIVPPPAPEPVELARTLPRHSAVTAFKGERKEEKAFRFGQWLLGRALFNADFAPCLAARKYCDEHGLSRAMGETTNEAGGYLVLPEFSNDLIDLREQYGVFRRNAQVVPMSSDTLTIPRRTSGLTPYFVAEAGSITSSDAGWDQVTLVAKKLAVLSRYSSEINEDSIIDFANTLANEIAYAFANKEDECGFNGDGTSTYGGIVGVRSALTNLSGTIAYISGLQVGTGNAYSELVLADFEGVVARLPQYADSEAAAWFVHRSFYWNVMVKAMLAVGGVTAAEVEDARRQRFMGYRVEFTQVMPKAEGNSQVCALLGDLSKAATLGSRRDTQIAFSEHSRFANDQIEIRGTERFDINVHDVGDYNATASSQNPGPIVGLITAAS